MRNIIGVVAVLGLASGLIVAFAVSELPGEAGAAPPAATTNIRNLSVLTPAGRLRTSAKAGEEMWGVGILENTGSEPATFDWTMTLDSYQISYGGWTVPSGKSSLLTSIASTMAVQGSHSLTLTLTSGSVVIGQFTAQITVR